MILFFQKFLCKLVKTKITFVKSPPLSLAKSRSLGGTRQRRIRYVEIKHLDLFQNQRLFKIHSRISDISKIVIRVKFEGERK